jgi:hypothetical protein
MPDMMAQMIEILAPAAGTLLLALVSWALAEAARYVRSRTENEAVNNAIARICHMTETVVAEVNQTVVDDIKLAAADGRLDKDQARLIASQALAMVYDRMAPGVLEIAARGVADLQEFVASRIERSVAEQKG